MKSEIDTQRRIDLQNYIDILPTCELYEDRIFFISGIINLLQQLNETPWINGKRKTMERLINEKLEQGYSNSELEKGCCVPRGQLGKGHYKRTIVGCLYGLC